MKIRCTVADTGTYRLGLLVGMDDMSVVGVEEVGEMLGCFSNSISYSANVSMIVCS